MKQQIEDVIGLDASDADPDLGQDRAQYRRCAGGARARGCRRPKGDRAAPLKALLVDSWYDAYLGVVVLMRVVDGIIKKGQRIRMMRTHATYEVDRVGVFTPKMLEAQNPFFCSTCEAPMRYKSNRYMHPFGAF